MAHCWLFLNSSFFVCVVGYWLGDGSLEGAGGYVLFTPVKETDCAYLDALFARLPLPNESDDSWGGKYRPRGIGYRRNVKRDNGQTIYRIVAPAWFAYFAAEYGGKYVGDAAAAAASANVSSAPPVSDDTAAAAVTPVASSSDWTRDVAAASPLFAAPGSAAAPQKAKRPSYYQGERDYSVWSSSEIAAFEEHLPTVGEGSGRWQRMAKLIGTKSHKQCASFGHRLLLKRKAEEKDRDDGRATRPASAPVSAAEASSVAAAAAAKAAAEVTTVPVVTVAPSAVSSLKEVKIKSAKVKHTTIDNVPRLAELK